ncbi:MAG: MFS transporter [Paracoccaceae bacterium]|nr:MFS transporter [Paracoccaceae bacterium]MDG1369976.1 MFS transporter [Paracoccaceae bacterium]
MATKKQGIWGWMFFDWASQPFHTLIITFIFAPYFASQVAESPERGQEIWGYAAAAASFTVAILAPILGAIADQSGPRKPWVAMFSVLYAIGASSLWYMTPVDPEPWLLLVGFAIGLIGVEFATVFTNSLLPELGTKEEVGRISGSGWAMGYWGGVLSLVVALALFVPAPGGEATLIGMAPIFGAGEGEGARATGPLTAVWYLVFMIPFFMWTPDTKKQKLDKGAVAAGLGQFGDTLKALPSNSSLFAYLMSSMFYRDALNGVYIFGGIFAAGVLGWGTFQLGIFGIVAAVAGAIGAWVGGRVDQSIGPKPVINFCIVTLMLVCAVMVSTGPSEILFLPLEEGSGLPTIAFYICGAVIGAAGGSLQSASRTMLIRQAEPGKMTEAFGIYALAGKATSFIAPFMIAVMTGAFESQRIGITPVIGLFLIGLILMFWVSRNGQTDAKA